MRLTILLLALAACFFGLAAGSAGVIQVAHIVSTGGAFIKPRDKAAAPSRLTLHIGGHLHRRVAQLFTFARGHS